MRSPLRHVPLPGDRVQLTFTPDEGKVVSALVDGAWLRAKCWGILADIDPAGLVDAALGLRLPIEPEEESAFSVADKILIALAQGPKPSRSVRAALKDPTLRAGDISTRCSDLAKRGLIHRIDGHVGRAAHATWKLTEKGMTRARDLNGRAAA